MGVHRAGDPTFPGRGADIEVGALQDISRLTKQLTTLIGALIASLIFKIKNLP